MERMARNGIVRDSGPWKLLREEFVQEVERGIDPNGYGDADGDMKEPDGDAELGFGDGVELDGDGEEGRVARSKIPPPAPSERDRRLHRVTHFPFRSWCPECVAGRGVVSGHHRSKEPDGALGGEFHFDYCFLKNRPADESATTLVGVDKKTQGAIAHVVPKKGTQFEWVAIQLEKDVRRFGYHGRVVVKSDGENAIKDLMSELARKRCDMPTVVEKSKPYDSKSNGRAENAVRRVESQVRTLKIALERSIQCELSVHHPVFEWLVEHVADPITKCAVGDDGRTAYERIKAKKNWNKLKSKDGVPKPPIRSTLQLELATKYFVRETPCTLEQATVVR